MPRVKDIISHFNDWPVFTYRDAKLYCANHGESKNLARTLSYMKSKGMLYSVRKGTYSFKNDDMVAGFSYAPFYYGLLSALSMRELWTQNARPEIITMKSVRRSGISIFGDKERTAFLHHIPAKYFFGFDILQYGSLKLPVSDPEKTLIDLVYYKIRLPIQNYSGLLKAVRASKVQGYLKAYDPHTRSAVMNFMKAHRRSAVAGKLDSGY